MARAGCEEVSLGFESGSDCVLKRFHKKFRAEEVRTTAAIFRDAGIRRTGFLMLGGRARPGKRSKRAWLLLILSISMH
jgi:radical SAM superfamily enzyme YgiQ (UPF0313 family)